MIALVVLGVVVAAAVLGWLVGPDTRDPNYSLVRPSRDGRDRPS